jgi:hypothetical protein
LKNLCIFPPPFIFHSQGSAFLTHLLLSAPSTPHFYFFFECAFEPSTIKGTVFSTLPPFECAFEPSTIKGSAFPTLPPFECVFEPCVPYPTSFQVRIRALTSFLFEYAFEPLTIKGSAFPILPPLECVFEPSLYFFSSAPSNSRPSKVVHFLSYLLLSAPSSPHLISFRVRLRALDHQR